MTLRPTGLKGPDPLHRRLSLSQRARMPADYEPKERSYPNLQHVRYWRDQPGGSCVGHGTAQGWETNTVRHGGSVLEPISRLHLYTLGLLQQTPPRTKLQDEGTYIDAVLTGLTRVGACNERDFPPTPENVAKRPSMEAEANGIAHADGHFWQIQGDGTQNGFWREVCWSIDTFGAVVCGKQVGNVYMEHVGDGLLPDPSATEVPVGGHCTVYAEYRNFGLELVELNSWKGWGYSRGIVGDDGHTRQIESLARVSRNWLWHPFFMNAYVWVPDSVSV